MIETVSDSAPTAQDIKNIKVDKQKLRLALINSFGSLERALTEAVGQPVNALAALKVVLSATESQDELATIVNAETPVIPEGQNYRSMESYYLAPLHRVIERVGRAGASVSDEDFQVVQTLVEAGADVNKPSGQNGGTPLFTSVGYVALASITEYLLDHGADVNAGSRGGYTPLSFALARNLNLSTIALLLDRGANPFAVTDKGEALEQLVNPVIPAMNMLIKARKTGRDVPVDFTRLELLVSPKNLASLRELAEPVPGDSNRLMTVNSDLLNYAVCREHKNITMALRYVLRARPLENALSLVPLLLDIEDPAKLSDTLNAPLNTMDEPSLLHALAKASGPASLHEKILGMLLGAGMNGHADGSVYVGSPLHLYAGKEGAAPLLRLLVQSGAEINGTDARGVTPLSAAAKAGQVENFKTLLDCGADLASCEGLPLMGLTLPMAFAVLDARGGNSEASVSEVGLAALFGKHADTLTALQEPPAIAPRTKAAQAASSSAPGCA